MESFARFVNNRGFFSGIFLIAMIDKLVPSFENPHEINNVEDMQKLLEDQEQIKNKHNLKQMGLFVAVAIAIHNIPEGIAVSVPLYYATGSRRKAFGLSFISGLSKPVGAMAGYFLFMRFFNGYVFGLIFAVVAGIMVFISLDELLPTAEEYGEHHVAMYGVVAGMAVMAASLLLFS